MTNAFEAQRSALEEERSRLLSQIETISGSPAGDFDANFADHGQVAAEQGENAALAEALRDGLSQVEAALHRIEQGTYGVCDVCGDAIGEARLEALPSTRHCIAHA
jgi:DnaK suppressor protein